MSNQSSQTASPHIVLTSVHQWRIYYEHTTTYQVSHAEVYFGTFDRMEGYAILRLSYCGGLETRSDHTLKSLEMPNHRL